MRQETPERHTLGRQLAVAAFIAVLWSIPQWCEAGDGTGWPTFRANGQRTGCVNERFGFPSSSPEWIMQLGAAIVSSPSIVGDHLFIGCRDSAIYALDIRGGSVVWSKKTRGWVDSSPLVFRDTLVVGSRDGTVYMLNALTGDSLGSFPAGLQLSSPGLSDDGDLLTGIAEESAHRFSVFRGLDPSREEPLRFFTQPCYSSPAVVDSIAVIAASDGILYGFDLSISANIWQVKTDGDVYLSTPAICDGTVYFAPGDNDRNVYAVRLVNGATIWKSSGGSRLAKRAADSGPASAPLAQYLLRLSPAHRARVIETYEQRGVATGLSHWLKTGRKGMLGKAAGKGGRTDGFLPDAGGVRTSSVAVDSQHVYVIQQELGVTDNITMAPVSRFTLLCLSSYDGREKWRYSEATSRPGLGYCSSPVATGNAVFFGWGDGRALALDSRTGAKQWEADLRGHILSSPAVAGDRVYFATMNGCVYAFALNQTPNGIDFQQSTFCYPNPAPGARRLPVSHIQVYVREPAELSMTIYSMADKPVVRVNRSLGADEKYTYRWDISRVANGVYFARILVDYGGGRKDRKTVKIAVLK